MADCCGATAPARPESNMPFWGALACFAHTSPRPGRSFPLFASRLGAVNTHADARGAGANPEMSIAASMGASKFLFTTIKLRVDLSPAVLETTSKYGTCCTAPTRPKASLLKVGDSTDAAT